MFTILVDLGSLDPLLEVAALIISNRSLFDVKAINELSFDKHELDGANCGVAAISKSLRT